MPPGFQIACFHVGDNDYALDIMRVKEVINPPPVTRVPNAPPFVEGIVELRGQFLPVVDLRKRFGVEPGEQKKILVARLADRFVGLVVDGVTEVRRVAPEERKEAPPGAIGPDSRFFSGVVKQDDRVFLMVDVEALLAPSEREELQRFEAAGGD